MGPSTTATQWISSANGRTMADDNIRGPRRSLRVPSDWALEVTRRSSLTTVDLEHPDGVAFLLVSTDFLCPDPARSLTRCWKRCAKSTPTSKRIRSRRSWTNAWSPVTTSQFFSLDLSNTARIRCFRTSNRTILVFGQWTDLVEAEVSDLAESIVRSIEETED